jgi:NADH-quinone oxidoreductase subunit L
MMFGLGVSGFGDAGTGYTGSLFHLFTHAFFKSLLFLGAGAVIHMVHSNEMKDMGGLKKLMPITHITFLLGCLAIAGVPPLSGFFSKEEILLAAWESNKVVYFIALITSGLTAFYMFRLYFSIFHNKENHHHIENNHHGEGTASMLLPLIILGAFTVGAGFLPFTGWVTSDGIPREMHLHLMFSIAPVSIGLAGIAFAYKLYFKENSQPERISEGFGAMYHWANRKFFIDELYIFITKKILFNILGSAAARADRNVVDGAVNGIAITTGKISEKIKSFQSGHIQEYAIWFIAGIICITAYLIYLFT